MSTDNHPLVQLRAAKIPFIGNIAVHYWLVTWHNQSVDRWEVWQRAHRCQHSWGHLHRNLMYYAQGVGNGASWVEAEWQGMEADLLIATIINSPDSYPYKYLYRYWPGPNSNTYVQWILNQAQTQYSLSSLGIGKDY
ncbi:DUF3750 domain-containing protein [Gloeocapsa sp. PCC 73106]|uniref:DUF3750 domain-containing protein n=1 Tax=Gloeocapsa sp. PCC 73106 TaxID=102232 RepID=UPI0002AC7367|nr:DUF3750 domain-containing protein [Gloeocapsa sp. PCC 73106]ELR98442.1 Protein of unknown function (DUF3750) [Gloeocapsa sp. PCC 73106]